MIVSWKLPNPRSSRIKKNCRVSWPCPPNAGVLSGKPATLVHWLSLGWNLLEDVSFRRGSAHLPTDVAHSSPQVLSSSNAMNRRMQWQEETEYLNTWFLLVPYCWSLLQLLTLKRKKNTIFISTLLPCHHKDHSTKQLQQATRTRITIKRPTFPAVNT